MIKWAAPLITLIAAYLGVDAGASGETFWESLNHWYNAVYIIPFTVVMILVILQIIGAGLDSVIDLATDAGVDMDADLDVDAGIDADVDAGIDADVDAGIDVDADMDLDAGIDADADLDVDAGIDADAGDADIHAVHVDHGFLLDLLIWFGAGRIPFSYIADFYFIVLGFTGLTMNDLVFRYQDRLGTGGAFAVSLAASFLVATIATKLLSIIWLKFLPTNEYTRISNSSFRGAIGEIVSAKVDYKGGRAHIKDAEGHLQVVFIRTAKEKKEIMKGEKIVLVKYLPETRMYIAKKKE